MTTKDIIKRISTLMLTLMLTLSLAGGAFVEAFAEGSEGTLSNEELEEEEGVLGEEGGQQEVTVPAQEPASDPETAQGSESDPDQAKDAEPSEVQYDSITVRASRDGSFITAMWKKLDNAAYYMVYLNDETEGAKVSASEKSRYTFDLGDTDLAVQKVRVEAYREKADDPAQTGEGGDNEGTNDPAPAEPQYEKFAEGTAAEISAIIRGGLSSFTSQAAYMNQNLRTMLGEPNSGYAVAQGSATDGTYAYHVMASSETQNGRIIKVNLSNPADYKTGPVINLHHANGMTYDSKRGLLVAVGYGAYRQQLTYIDPDTLQIESQPTLKYNNITKDGGGISGMPVNAQNNGIAAIAYVKEYDVYVARSRGKVDGYPETTSSAANDIWVFDADTLEALGFVRTKVTSAYNGTYQSMDADDKYVYFLASPGGNVNNNIILCLDWNSENLIPVRNGDADYVDEMWYCNNDGSGKPDAVITVPVGKESEGVFHTTDSNGKSHFYVTEYYGRNHYKTVTVTEKYKVKWKKVTKKVKWKKVKRKGKWKWKYKKKKVWKYKTKTRKVTKTVKDYWARDDYVYDLGVF